MKPAPLPPANDVDEDEDGDALIELLSSFGTDEEWAAGFLTAIHSGPDLVAPSVWLPEIMGGAQFASLDAAREGLPLLMSFYNLVGGLLADGDVEALCPDPGDIDDVARFCSGYVRGTHFHRSWPRHEKAFVPIFVFTALAGELGEELEGPDEKPHPDPEGWKRERREDVVRLVAHVYEYFASARRAGVTAPGKASQATSGKVGRNEPCPCGSGKKHKRCCAA